jgi:hypothetical protein
MEPKGSLPHSQKPVTCPYLEPDLSSPCLPFHLFKIHFNVILPCMARYFKVSFPRFLNQNPVCSSAVSHTCHIPHLSHCSWFEHLNNSVQTYSRPHYFVPQISSSVPFSWTTSAKVPFSVWETKFHTYTKQQAKWWFYNFNLTFCTKLENKRFCTVW